MKIKHTADATLLARLVAANINQTTPTIRRETPVEQVWSSLAFAALAVGLSLLYIIFG